MIGNRRRIFPCENRLDASKYDAVSITSVPCKNIDRLSISPSCFEILQEAAWFVFALFSMYITHSTMVSLSFPEVRTTKLLNPVFDANRVPSRSRSLSCVCYPTCVSSVLSPDAEYRIFFLLCGQLFKGNQLMLHKTKKHFSFWRDSSSSLPSQTAAQNREEIMTNNTDALPLLLTSDTV